MSNNPSSRPGPRDAQSKSNRSKRSDKPKTTARRVTRGTSASRANTTPRVVDAEPEFASELEREQPIAHASEEGSAETQRSAVEDVGTDASTTSFDDLDLSKVMRRALKKHGYETPSPIQAQVIPPALEGSDIIGQARTGTGKTAAFAIPILECLDPLRECRNPQALILVPTRELAEQVHQEITRLAHGCKTSITVLAGGKHMRRQIRQLQEGTQVIVGTPGRVQDHIQRKTFRTHDLWCVVLDEADRMLDIGFRPAIERILRSCPKDRQTMLLSATLAPEIQKLTERYLRDPVHINCSSKQLSVATIEQRYFSVDHKEKFTTLVKLLRRESPRQAIIFCRTKRGTDRLHLALEKELQGIPSLAQTKLACIHGDMNQRDRDRVFGELRAGKIGILAATDVVGRGIDVSTVSHIINYDIPLDCDDYVHRVGRTGRMGREGIAFTFVTKDEGPQLTAIEANINLLLQRDEFESDVKAREEEEAKAAAEAEAAPPEPKKKRLFPTRRVTRRR